MKEAIWIKKTKPTLNRDSGYSLLPILCTSVQTKDLKAPEKRKVKEAIWIKKTKPTLNRDSGYSLLPILCTSNFKTAASQQRCKRLTRIKKVHRSGRKLANEAVLLTEMAANRTQMHAHDLLRKISRVSHLAPPVL